MKYSNLALLFIALSVVTGCKKQNLRGKTTPSKDGKTYFAVADNNGGGCGPIYVDGKPWTLKLNEPGPITPGAHKIKCGEEVEFQVPNGVIFSFDYWGP